MAVVEAYGELAEKFNYGKSLSKSEANDAVAKMLDRLETSCNLSHDMAVLALNLYKSDASGDRAVRFANELNKNLLGATKVINCILRSESELFNKGTLGFIRRLTPKNTYNHTKYQIAEKPEEKASIAETKPRTAETRPASRSAEILRQETVSDKKHPHRGRPAKLTEEKIAELSGRWGNGEKVEDLAKEANASAKYLYSVCEKPKTTAMTSPASNAAAKIERNIDSIIEKKIGGKSFNVLAKEYQVSVSHLHKKVSNEIERRISAGDKSAIELKKRLSVRADLQKQAQTSLSDLPRTGKAAVQNASVKKSEAIESEAPKPPRNMVKYKTIERIFSKHEGSRQTFKKIAKANGTNVRFIMNTLVYKARVLADIPNTFPAPVVIKEIKEKRAQTEVIRANDITKGMVSYLETKVSPEIEKDVIFIYGFAQQKAKLAIALYMVDGLGAAAAAKYAGISALKMQKVFAYLRHKNVVRHNVRVEIPAQKGEKPQGLNGPAQAAPKIVPEYVNPYETAKARDMRMAREAQKFEEFVAGKASEIGALNNVQPNRTVSAIKHYMRGAAELLPELQKAGLETKDALKVAKSIKANVPVNPNMAYIESYLAQKKVN